MTLRRQVQRGVLEVQVLRFRGPIGEPGDGDLADDGLKAAAVTCLDRLMSDACLIDDRTGMALPGGAQVQVVLEQLAEQLPAAGGEPGLELVVGERPGLGAGEEADEGAVDGIRAAEGARRDLVQRARRSRETSCASPAFASSSRRLLAVR